MFLFIKFTLISTLSGSFFSSTFQRNNHVSQCISIESFAGHAVWVWSRSTSCLPAFDTWFPKSVACWALQRLQSLCTLLTKGFLNSVCLQQIKVHKLWGEIWSGNELAAKHMLGRPAALHSSLQVLPLLPCVLPSEAQPKLLFLHQTAVIRCRLQFLLGCTANTTSGPASETPHPQDWAGSKRQHPV